MNCSYIFFDIAGTLLFKKHLFETIQMCLLNEGYSVPIKVLLKHHTIVTGIVPSPSKPSKEFYNSFNAAYLYGLGIIPNQRIVDSLYAQCKALPWHVYEDAGILKVISQRKGIISNWDETLTDKLKILLPYTFDLIFGSEMLGLAKPSKALYEKAFEETHTPVAEIIYIGDSIILDVEPALSLGVKAILIDRENQYPWYTGIRIRSLQELPKVIQL